MFENLSINILTFNRVRNLKNLLKDLYEQDSINTKRIKLNIFDNGSSENYSSLLNKYKKKFIINYTRHPKNIGFTRNYNYALKKCNSKFIWILSDDDRLNKRSLLKISNLIKFANKNNFKFLSFGINKNNKNNKNYKKIIFNKDVLFLEYFSSLGKISNIIMNNYEIKKNKINTNISNLYPHLEIFQKIYNLDKSWIHLNDLVILDSKNTVRTDSGQNVNFLTYAKNQDYISSRLNNEINSYSKTLMSIKDIDNILKKKTLNILFKRNIRSWFILAKIYLKSKKLKKSRYLYYLENNLDLKNKVFYWLINLLPIFILKPFYLFKNKPLRDLQNFFYKNKVLIKNFFIVGAVNTLVSYILGIFFYKLFYKNYGFFFVNTLNIIFGITISFLNFKFFAFKTKVKYIFIEYFRSILVYASKVIIGSLFLWLTLEVMRLNIYISQAISILSTVLITFFGHKNFTFINSK